MPRLAGQRQIRVGSLSGGAVWGYQLNRHQGRRETLWLKRAEQFRHSVCVDRLRKVISLQFRAAQLRHDDRFKFRLDPLGDDIHAQSTPDRHDRDVDPCNSTDEGQRMEAVAALPFTFY